MPGGPCSRWPGWPVGWPTISRSWASVRSATGPGPSMPRRAGRSVRGMPAGPAAAAGHRRADLRSGHDPPRTQSRPHLPGDRSLVRASGPSIARLLAARGLGVTLVARSEDRLELLADELADQHGVRAEVIVADLTDEASRTAIADRARAPRPSSVNVLVNNAGFSTMGPVYRSDPGRRAGPGPDRRRGGGPPLLPVPARHGRAPERVPSSTWPPPPPSSPSRARPPTGPAKPSCSPTATPSGASCGQRGDGDRPLPRTGGHRLRRGRRHHRRGSRRRHAQDHVGVRPTRWPGRRWPVWTPTGRWSSPAWPTGSRPRPAGSPPAACWCPWWPSVTLRSGPDRVTPPTVGEGARPHPSLRTVVTPRSPRGHPPVTSRSSLTDALAADWGNGGPRVVLRHGIAAIARAAC